MVERVKGWTGKRLLVDLTIQRAWTEEISAEELATDIGGRGLNGRYFLNRVHSLILPSAPESPIAFSVGPLAGTYAPCASWTSISALSPLPFPSRYVHANLPGHWGPQLKLAGFDQMIIMGKAEEPLYLSIGAEGASFKDGKHLWGKNTVETTVAIEEKEGDRNIEVLCIGPQVRTGFFLPTRQTVFRGQRITWGWAISWVRRISKPLPFAATVRSASTIRTASSKSAPP